MNKPLVVHMNLKFDDNDVNSVVRKASTADEGNYHVWYLTVPFPNQVFTEVEFDLSGAQKDEKPTKVWKYEGIEAMDKYLQKITRFLTIVQGKMPRGNFVTLMPVFPTTFVTIGSCDNVVRTAMQSLGTKIAHYTQDDERTLTTALQDFQKKFKEIFDKTSLHYIQNYDAELLAPVNVIDMNTAVTSIEEQHVARVQKWLGTFNALLKNFNNKCSATFSDEMAAFRPAAQKKNEEETESSTDAKD